MAIIAFMLCLVVGGMLLWNGAEDYEPLMVVMGTTVLVLASFVFALSL